MAGCPQCGKAWPDAYQRCPEDGVLLIAQAATGGLTSGGAALELSYPSDEDLAPGSFAGEYRIEKKIGEGGMGSVYGARHPLIGKRAAIKVIRRALSGSREAVDRFVLEAQSVNQIGHPNIVDVFGFGQLPDGRSFFVMEWLEGESLRERLQRSLPFPEALEILEAIAKALQAAHEAGVVHRDLKPDNVFLQARKGDKPTVKLLDFGLAKLTGGDGGQQFERTRTGVVMGTPLYLSPEQAKGQRIDAATDVYSLGAMAYEMLSGVVPFKADSAVEIMAMHISAPAVPLVERASWVPAEINALVMQMLEKAPQHRPATAEVHDRIGACRNRASAATIGLHIHPSSQPPPYTPQVPYAAMQTPGYGTHGHMPAMHGAGSQPPAAHLAQTPMGYVQPTQPAGTGNKNMILILVALAVMGAAIGGGAFVVFGNKGADKTNAVAAEQSQPDPDVSAAGVTGGGSDQVERHEPEAAKPEAASAELARVEPAAAEPATSEPATSEAATSEPATPEPATPEPAKPATSEPAKPAKPAKREPPKRGRVVVSFDGPSRATILVDGKRHGREVSGRVTLELAPGEHTVRVQARGYKPVNKRVRVEPGGARDVKLTLEKRTSVNAVHDPFAD